MSSDLALPLPQVSSLDLPRILSGQVRESTLVVYRRDVAAYTAFCLEASIESLDPRSLATWRDSLVLETAKSPKTINRMLASVRSVVSAAAKPERAQLDSAVGHAFQSVSGVQVGALRHRVKPHARTRISPEDMRRLSSAPDPATLRGLRDRALLHTLASSGLRASEVASLTVGQMVRQGRGYLLMVQGKGEKDEMAFAPLSGEAHQAIMGWLASRPVICQAIFTGFAGRGESRLNQNAMSPSAIWQTVQKYARQCDLPHVKPHDFRRFVGTQLAKKNIEMARKALRHKNIRTTIDHYVLDALEPGETDQLY